MTETQEKVDERIETPVVVEAPASDVDPVLLGQRVEAILLSVDRPLTAGRIAEVLELDATRGVTDAIKALNTEYEAQGRSFRIEQVAGGYQILTLPAFKDVLAQLHRTKVDNRLSPAGLETLAIIAYRQPVLRAQIEAVRGVSSGEVIRTLMDRHLVKIVGRAEEIGRPMLYGTTKTFLELFGLANLKDLPKIEELVKP
ncbi:MAG: SMC-Scp complex subunit ScpB [Planctomycetaceae bacterium]|nr:SMC-Scp complex subunit ScpB [Planctomycetaceae bacterium]